MSNEDRDSRDQSDPAQALLVHASPVAREGLANHPGLSSRVEELLAAAHQQWPPTWVPRDVFLRFVTERLPEDSDPLKTLEVMAIPDLYLACACAQGVESAVKAFTDQCFPAVLAAVRKAARGAHLDEDIQQTVFEKVFFGRGDQAPRIARYSGRGSLKNWIRIVAIRETQDHLRHLHRERPALEPQGEYSPVVEQDPELAMFKEKYRDEFDECFRIAVSALGDRERNILRYHIVDGLELQTIARLYRVHRVTMSRWVRRIREQVIDRTREELSRRLGASQQEVSSIMRIVRSRLAASVSQYLVR